MLLEIIAPAMLTALVVGLGIGLLQALTQIQEMTLVFVPKIIAIFVVLLDRPALCRRGDGRTDDRHRAAHRRLLDGTGDDAVHIHLPELSGIILTYLLVFARTGAMVMLLPALGEGACPAQVRLVLALAISRGARAHRAKRLSAARRLRQCSRSGC